ncbi:MAG: aminoacyl-tRNA hydrolase [Acidimicrobiia bacterium]|nr:aminoacyl-tRNA hydrolase [Acidimicrobiia bacterium]
MNEPLEIRPGLTVPAAELAWRFDPSGGPGGQHANRASSRAELSFDLGASPSVPDDLRARMLTNLGPRARNGMVIVTVDESRSQWRNRAIARKRLERLLREACRLPRSRRETRPSAGARRRRREEKRRRSETKNLRRRPEPE